MVYNLDFYIFFLVLVNVDFNDILIVFLNNFKLIEFYFVILNVYKNGFKIIVIIFKNDNKINKNFDVII